MDPRQNQSQQRGNASNIPHNQPANSHRQHGHQSQNQQTNSAGSYAGAPPVGAPSGYGQPNQQPANTSHDYQPQGYTNNTQVVDPYTHSPVGHEGGSGSITRQTPPNPPVHAARMGQHVAPTLQQSHSSRGSASGREWNAQASHQPSHGVRSGNPVQLHNVQEQHHYVHGGLAQASARDIPGSSGFSRSSNNICKIPDCSRLGFFNSQIQEQLDYCEAHLLTALGGYAAACKRCGSLPVLEDLDYCSRFCAGGGRSGATVPLGFAPACQECRRAITENMQIYGGNFCSPDCWNAYRRTHPSRR
ncbi:hypothetical protein BGY98DRAFT_337445 [Russula aff. rugulosa BPL654]|nr:hypothetical protein BGY98DRAFT_337445 [Russula aff. rugulosa BPL654]